MKKTLALILALMLVLALFAGCNNGGGTTTPTAAPATQAPASAAPATQAPSNQGSTETAALAARLHKIYSGGGAEFVLTLPAAR